MSRSAAQREAARTKKQRQRDRKRLAVRLAVEREAEMREATAEYLAPAIMRQSITSPDGRMLVGPRVLVTEGKPARSNALEMEIGLTNRDFTDAMKDAMKKFRLDWSDVGVGINVAAVDYLRSGGGCGGSGGHQAILEQVRARVRLEGAMAHLGAFAPMVCRVVLDCVPISVWVLEGDPIRTPPEGVADVLLALARLVSFYDPPSTKRVVIRTIGPRREEYTTDVDVDA